MFGVGSTELLVILVVALLVLGPSHLPKIARTLGKTMGEFRRVSSEFQRTLTLEAEREEHGERKKRAEKEFMGEESAREEKSPPSDRAEERAESEGGESGLSEAVAASSREARSRESGSGDPA
jgi:sec-independent protein translocase protein TatB